MRPGRKGDLAEEDSGRARRRRGRVRLRAGREFRHITGTATITGVGFFDFPHGQTGHAPNDIELHPVLKFTGTCS
jgi:hypothetical protein